MTKMVGFGCDGTNANIAEGGILVLMKCTVFWGLAHCLELAIKKLPYLMILTKFF